MRRFIGAAVAVMFVVGVALSDEFTARITKIDGAKVTVVKGKKGEKGEEFTYNLTKNAKFVKGVFDKETKTFKAGDPIEGGKDTLLKMIEKAGEKGINARIVTEGDTKNITEIRVVGGKGGKKKDAN
jgi:hypothetical protein